MLDQNGVVPENHQAKLLREFLIQNGVDAESLEGKNTHTLIREALKIENPKNIFVDASKIAKIESEE